jgi:hypothetical protein
MTRGGICKFVHSNTSILPPTTPPHPKKVEVALDAARNPPGPPQAPRFGICSSEARTVNVTAWARAGYRLTELRAFEGARTGCVELLAQTLAARDGSGRVAVVKSDGQAGLHVRLAVAMAGTGLRMQAQAYAMHLLQRIRYLDTTQPQQTTTAMYI